MSKKKSQVKWCFDCIHEGRAVCCDECMEATGKWITSNHEDGEYKPFFIEREEGDIDDS